MTAGDLKGIPECACAWHWERQLADCDVVKTALRPDGSSLDGRPSGWCSRQREGDRGRSVIAHRSPVGPSPASACQGLSGHLEATSTL